MSESRRARGRQTEHIVAAWFASHGWPHAEAAPKFAPGSDIQNMPGLDVEVKARRGLDLTGALRQQAARDHDLGLVVIRPDGYGPARIGDWPVAMTLTTATRLLRLAGYGEPEDA